MNARLQRGYDRKAAANAAKTAMRREQDRLESLGAWRCRARRKSQREIRRLSRVAACAMLDYMSLTGDWGRS